MKTFYWLVKREFWEHRGGFLWAPVIAAGVTVLLIVMGIIAGEVVGARHGVHIGFDMNWLSQRVASGDDLRNIGAMLDITALMPALIVCVVLFFVLFSYCMKTLSSDRRDRSILFWKSLPVSDLATVLSKVFSAVIVAPIIAGIAGIVAALLTLFIMAITASFHGLGFGQVFWTLPHFGHIVAVIGGLLPVYMIWMLPTVGWLMMCSAWSSGRVARWALAIPIGASVVVSWFGIMGLFNLSSEWFWRNIAARLLLSVAPGSWLPEFKDAALVSFSGGSDRDFHFHTSAGSMVHSLAVQYQLLLTPAFLWGILAGAVMIAVAIWLRRWRTEL